MTVSAARICQAGVSYPAAIEIARQMNAGAGNGKAERLVASGIHPMAATEIARQINAGAFSADLLCRAMLNYHLANIIKIDSGL